MGRFREQVERYLAVFPAEQVCVIRFRDWTADPRTTYLRIIDFLGLDDDGRTEFPPINQGMTYRSRSLARLTLRPPTFVRAVARQMRKLALGRRLDRAVRTVGFRSTPGYKGEITAELRDQIRRYYDEENRLLEERFRGGVIRPE